ncbi:MAG: hypothetical protein ABI339_08160 [Solirubrobacteraceae bacterium]
MPRCCATILDRATAATLVYIEIDTADEGVGLLAAKAAAEAAFAKTHPGMAVPQIYSAAKNGQMPTQQQIDNL